MIYIKSLKSNVKISISSTKGNESTEGEPSMSNTNIMGISKSGSMDDDSQLSEEDMLQNLAKSYKVTLHFCQIIFRF